MLGALLLLRTCTRARISALIAVEGRRIGGKTYESSHLLFGEVLVFGL
jgi:hypothetical protein